MRSNNNENKSPVDTTVTYLSLMKPSDIKRAKMAENRKREEENAKMMAAEAAERERLLKLFTDHAFLFLTCADAIMAEPKIACVEIPTENGMAFTGAMPTPTIGTYVEMWTTSPYAVRFYKKGLSLMWGISGNPMTGSNGCAGVFEDGTWCHQEPFGRFLDVAQVCGSKTGKYQRMKHEMNVEPYTLDEAVQWAENQITPDIYRKRINAFTCKIHRMQMQLTVENTNEQRDESNKEADIIKRTYIEHVLLNNIDKIRQIVVDTKCNAFSQLFPENAPERQLEGATQLFAKIEELVTIDYLSDFLERNDKRKDKRDSL